MIIQSVCWSCQILLWRIPCRQTTLAGLSRCYLWNPVGLILCSLTSQALLCTKSSQCQPPKELFSLNKPKSVAKRDKIIIIIIAGKFCNLLTKTLLTFQLFPWIELVKFIQTVFALTSFHMCYCKAYVIFFKQSVKKPAWKILEGRHVHDRSKQQFDSVSS